MAPIIAERKIQLPGGGSVSVDERRVRVDVPSNQPSSIQATSSAIHNGGQHTFSASSSPITYLNYKVPPTYNGYDPSPEAFLADFMQKEGLDANRTVGLLTAASMETLATSSRSAQGVVVDAVVTAGLSNARSAGADADWFVLTEGVQENGDDGSPTPPGTINSLVVVNTPLTDSARVEAYAIAVEAKCKACADHGVTCGKDPTALAHGTGTDCCVLLLPGTDASTKAAIKHAGKHTLFAELIGQAVYEATSEAIMINIRYLHRNYAIYTLKRWTRTFIHVMRGARPCIPPYPMMPVPNAPTSVVLMGLCSVLLAYCSTPIFLSEKAGMLLAAVAWDRYLGEPPLRVHPVCLAGSAISAVLSRVPVHVYKNPVLGFGCGLTLLAGMLAVFIPGAGLFLWGVDAVCERILSYDGLPGLTQPFVELCAWILKLLLLKSTFSLQLLCTIALQMAKFLERNQLDEARMQLSWLCSRDPSKLGSAELAGGTLESLSENLSDGFVAPLFWYVIFGPLGSLAYRVINTLDSRVGYRGTFEWFGKPSARLDDIINFIPARVTAILLAVAACLVPGCSGSRGLATAWRDQNRCESPNAGWPMACFAGLLGVRLEKNGEYCLGTGPEPGPKNIRMGHRVAQLAGAMAMLGAVVACAFIEVF